MTAQQDMVLWKETLQFPDGSLDQCKFIDFSAVDMDVTPCDMSSCSLDPSFQGGTVCSVRTSQGARDKGMALP